MLLIRIFSDVQLGLMPIAEHIPEKGFYMQPLVRMAGGLETHDGNHENFDHLI
jgi:hypothetical protein